MTTRKSVSEVATGSGVCLVSPAIASRCWSNGVRSGSDLALVSCARRERLLPLGMQEVNGERLQCRVGRMWE